MATEVLVRVGCPLCEGVRTRHERVVRGYALERCRRCAMVFANPQVPQDHLLAGYEERGSTQAILAFYDRVTTPTRLAEYDRILGDLEALVPQRGRLLDFGCGAGFFVEQA